LFVREPVTQASVVDAIGEHHTVTLDRRGHAYEYRGSSALDRRG